MFCIKYSLKHKVCQKCNMFRILRRTSTVLTCGMFISWWGTEAYHTWMKAPFCGELCNVLMWTYVQHKILWPHEVTVNKPQISEVLWYAISDLFIDSFNFLLQSPEHNVGWSDTHHFIESHRGRVLVRITPTQSILEISSIGQSCWTHAGCPRHYYIWACIFLLDLCMRVCWCG